MMSRKIVNRGCYIPIFIGCLFLVIGIHYWYDLNQIEQGLKEGSLSIILHTVYRITGKWGVGTFFWAFSLFCFCSAYRMNKRTRDYMKEIENDNKQ